MLVRKDAFHKLKKRWFAGGTVRLAAVMPPHHILAHDYERFENGTINYLDIPAITNGLRFIKSIGIKRLSERISSLVDYIIPKITDISYSSGNPVVKVFGSEQRINMGGGTIIMSFFDAEGGLIPFEEVESAANKRMISIRSGCFCNPGIDEVNNCITTDELASYFTSHEDGNYHEMISYLNKMRGTIRLSVGMATNHKDLDTFVEFVESFRG